MEHPPAFEKGTYHTTSTAGAEGESSFDDFIHRKTRILNVKLEVLATEIHHRWQIRSQNLERITEHKDHVSKLLTELDHRTNYMVRQHREKAPFYEQLFKLEQERRTEDVECWRDVFMAIKEWLYAWGAHEEAKAKAIFLNDV